MKRTSNNIHQLICDGSLATTIVLHLEGPNHVACILGRVIHGVSAGTLFACVSLDECGVQCVGEGELCKVPSGVVFVFIDLERV